MDEVVHGIPGKRVLKEGDIVALDFGAIFDGWVGDSGLTVPVGTIAPEAQHLLDVTKKAREVGIAQAVRVNAYKRSDAPCRPMSRPRDAASCATIRGMASVVRCTRAVGAQLCG